MRRQDTLEGIVLRVVPTSDGASLLTLLTQSRGKITLSAPGSRAVNSQRHSLCQPFAYGEFFVTEQRADRWVLKEGTLKESFYPLREDLAHFALASYFADVVLQVATQEEDQAGLLRLLLNSLYVLAYRDKPNWFVKAVFEWRLTAEMGYQPDLTSCMDCGKERGHFTFAISEGQLLCIDCMQKEGAPIGVHLEHSLPLLRSVLMVPLQKIFSFEPGEAMRKEFSSLAEKNLLAHLEYFPSTLQFWRTVED